MTASRPANATSSPIEYAAWPTGMGFAAHTLACVLCDEWARHCRAATSLSVGMADAWLKSAAVQQESATLAHNHDLYLFLLAGRYVPMSSPATFMAIAMDEVMRLAMSSLRGGLEFSARSQSNLLACLQEHYGDPVEYLEDLRNRLSVDALLQVEEGLHSATG